MKKYIQNRVAESKLSLPLTACYAVAVWLAAGLLSDQLWLQAACWALASGVMMELNNANALIRIYSRMISCSFIALSCAAPFLFHSLACGVVGLCVCLSWLLLFNSYQDKEASGWTFYAFACIGVASMAFPQILFLLPTTWLLMATNLQSLSWRTLAASLFGIALPYWFAVCWLTWTGDFAPLTDHVERLVTFGPLADYTAITTGQALAIGFNMLMAAIGAVHFWRQKSNDKIRVRQLYGLFLWIDITALAIILLQPQLADGLLPVLIICTSPLAGHFLALTRSRVSNVTFVLAVAAVVAITVYNLLYNR
ncbi:MAG: hypothetical protein IJ637_07815 [Prevotella sp.]|nr:hypothetical protein [Prevotella sp.]